MRVSVKGEWAGRVSAISATETAISSCITRIHHRLLRKISTKGLQSGLMSHGRPMRLVRSATRPLSMPKSLNIRIEMVLTMK